jgi:hypothetical protein
MKTRKQKRKSRNKTAKAFLFHANNPAKSFDVYIDKNPADTIPIKYTTVDDVKATIHTLERLYKSHEYPHQRIWQVGMILYVRLRVLKNKKPEQYELAHRYFQFLKYRTSLPSDERYKLQFAI